MGSSGAGEGDGKESEAAGGTEGMEEMEGRRKWKWREGTDNGVT